MFLSDDTKAAFDASEMNSWDKNLLEEDNQSSSQSMTRLPERTRL